VETIKTDEFPRISRKVGNKLRKPIAGYGNLALAVCAIPLWAHDGSVSGPMRPGPLGLWDRLNGAPLLGRDKALAAVPCPTPGL
jgi:hypothetical protein